jgi:hypothetical protein
MFGFIHRPTVVGFLLGAASFPLVFAGDLSLQIVPRPASNRWEITLHEAIPSSAYTLVSSPDVSAGSWQDTAVIQAGTGATRVAIIDHSSPELTRFFKVRESSREDFDGDGLNNRAEFDATSDPVRSDTDGDQFSDYEEVVLNHTDPNRPEDGVEMLEDSRRMILAKWAMIYPVPPVFTNRPGSTADLADLENSLRQLSGLFFANKE